MNDHIKALFEGQELSEDFKEKTSTILESMISEKETEIREKVEAEQRELFETQIDEKTAELEAISEKYVTEEVVPTISKYLSAAVSEWLQENQIAVESGIKVELAESFLKGFVGLAEAHNLSVPEGADSIVEKTQTELVGVKRKLDELTEKHVEMKEVLDEQTKSIIIDRVCSNLTESQKEKFTSYVDHVDFKTEQQFESAVSQLKESYFPKDAKIDESETIDDKQLMESKEEDVVESKWLQSFVSKL